MAMRHDDEKPTTKPVQAIGVDMAKASAFLGVDLEAELAGPRYTLDDIRRDRERKRK